MATKVWETLKVHFCEHAGQEVSLDAEVVYPAEWLPDQPPQIMAHRCSSGLECNLRKEPTCVWAGTNPSVDPYL